MRAGRTVAAFAAAIIASGALVACSDDDSRSSGSTTTASTGTSGPGPTTPGSGSAGDPAGSVRLVDLGLDLDQPIDLTVRPDSTSLIVAERGGAIREAVADGDGFRLSDEPVIDLTERVGSTDSERGMLGVAVAPDGAHLYVSYTEATQGASRIDAYPLSGSDGSLRADPDGRRQLLAIPQPFPNHNGGSLRFGTDGMLYAGFGDGGSADDPDGNGQARDTLLGKILRIDPTAADGVPADNPFVDGDGSSAAVEPLIWATGLRNPWRIDIDPSTGDLWIGDVGQNEFEEIDLLRATEGGGKGANLGWDLYEGTSPFADANPAPGAASAGPFVEPVLTYSHDEGCSITGGLIVRSPSLASLDGWYLYSDYCKPGVRAARVADDGKVSTADLGLDIATVAAFGRGPGGSVFVVSLDDGVQQIVPA